MTQRPMGDATFGGWQSWVANSIAAPPVFGTGPAWTTANLDTVAATPGWANTIMLGIYSHTSQSPSNTTVIDVENAAITSVSVIETWLNAQLAKPGGYSANRPTIYLSANGSYWVGASLDVLTPLHTAGYYQGVHYDLWPANTTNVLPTVPIMTNLGPGGGAVASVVIQWASYSQTGFNYDFDTIFDDTWYGAVQGPPPAAATSLLGYL